LWTGGPRSNVGVRATALLPNGSVEATFGAPTTRHAPVGGGSASTPPITRWDYPAFSVYFENSHVVNAVLTKASELEIGPAPAGT